MPTGSNNERSWPDRGEPPERVLLIRPSALGDVCRTVPLISSLRAAFPAARIDWLVQDAFADAVRAHPGLTGVVPFPRAELARWYTPGGAATLWRWAKGLRRGRYDLVIDAQGLLRSGLMAMATRAPVRVGHADAKELGWIGLNRRVRTEAVHTVDRMLSLLSAVGVEPVRDMQLHCDPAARVRAREIMRAVGGMPARRYALLAPTSRWPGKRWPIERFTALANGLLSRGVVDAVAVVGTKSERDQCGRLLALARARGRGALLDLVGALNVGELLAVVEGAAVVVGNDSAVVHMAVGLERPLVGLYGPTDVAKVGPYGREADVVQHTAPGEALNHKDARTGSAMMARISVDEVAQRVERALGSAAPSAGAVAAR